MTRDSTPEPTPSGAPAVPAPPAGHPRRTVLRGAVVLGALGAGGVLAGCGGGGGGDSAEQGSVAAPGTVLGPTSDVPSGGGKIYPEAKVVVTQPSMGEYKAFSAVCTHESCVVSSVENGNIVCGCHGSAYSISDGSVVKPPSTKPLEALQITVEGGQLKLA